MRELQSFEKKLVCSVTITALRALWRSFWIHSGKAWPTMIPQEPGKKGFFDIFLSTDERLGLEHTLYQSPGSMGASGNDFSAHWLNGDSTIERICQPGFGPSVLVAARRHWTTKVCELRETLK